MKKLGVGLVGCGYVANGHLQAWKKVADSRIVAVSDLNEDLARETARKWYIPKFFTSFSDMIACKDVDIIDICTPPQTHANLATLAMKAGHRVLIEKPMTMVVNEAREIADCQKKMDAKASVIHNWLFEPPVLRAASIVRNGDLGRVLGISIEALSTKYDSMAANEHHWCHSLPGGRFSEMLAHPIYLARRFLGNGELADLHVSKIGEYSWMKSDELCATFDCDGRLARVYASFNAPREAILLSIYGTKAMLRVDIINATLNILPRRDIARLNKGFDVLRQATQLLSSVGSNSARVLSRRWLSGHEMCIKLFAQSLSNGGDVPVPIKEGCAVVESLEKMCDQIQLKENRQFHG